MAQEKREAVVFGSGSWLKRLVPGMKQFGIEPVAVVGNSPVEVGQERIEGYGLRGASYINHSQLVGRRLNSGTVAMVISRPAEHGGDAVIAAGAGVEAVLIEKPVALTQIEARQVQAALGEKGVRLVASDHYLHKAKPLWWAAGMEADREYLGVRRSSLVDLEAMWGSLSAIGRITGVEARLIEGGGDPQGLVGHRSWLTDSKQGGVLYDTAIHLYAIGAKLGLMGEVRVREVEAEVVDPQSGLWRAVSQFGGDPQAELLARVVFETDQGVKMEFVVGKVGRTRPELVTRVNKGIVICGERGKAEVNLTGPRGQVDVEVYRGRKKEKRGVILAGIDAYSLVSREFVRAVKGQGGDGNVAVAIRAVELVEMTREIYNQTREPTLVAGAKLHSLPVAA
ncbi:MAG: Gfo/Idh/MocA family oxidoreductase [Candidatus Chisholmbacteria bacterium]|nr:Gfo/Idh/MocA family oxidoreductase [Candidatus Chisholmbacteria bacterium]